MPSRPFLGLARVGSGLAKQFVAVKIPQPARLE